MLGGHRLSVPMAYWKSPYRFSYGWDNGPPLPRCGESRQQLMASFATHWPDFAGTAHLATRQSKRAKAWHSDLDQTWQGSIEFRVSDENATEQFREWEEGGVPHPARSFSEMLDAHEKEQKRTTEVTVRRDPAGQIVAYTSCGIGLGRMVGCEEQINHSGLRIEISFAKALRPYSDEIESGVTKVLDDWSK
jgi:hypothetical protein